MSRRQVSAQFQNIGQIHNTVWCSQSFENYANCDGKEGRSRTKQLSIVWIILTNEKVVIKKVLLKKTL